MARGRKEKRNPDTRRALTGGIGAGERTAV